MRKLKLIEHISLDGVIQAPGGPDEDRDQGFAWGGWAAPHHDPVVGEAIDAAQGDRYDLLLGRRTYDIFAGYWPSETGPMADSLNAARKFVATHHGDTLAWGPAEALGADIAAGIRRAKASDGPDLVVWGSSSITPLILGEDLADEIVLLVFPVLIGRGKPLFSDLASPRELKLIKSVAAPSGVVVNSYAPGGPMRAWTIGEAG